MKSHLALAPEYINAMKIDIMASDLEQSFLKFGNFILYVPHCDELAVKVFIDIFLPFSMSCIKRGREGKLFVEKFKPYT